MKSWRLYVVSLICRLLPETRCFGMKRALYCWCGAKIGKNVRICSSVTILGIGHLEIGEDVWIGHQTFLSTADLIKIGSAVDIAGSVYIGTGTHQIDTVGAHSAGIGYHAPIVLEDGVWIGACTTILPGVVIGRKSVIGAGSVVSKSIPERSVAVGVPAKVMRSL